MFVVLHSFDKLLAASDMNICGTGLVNFSYICKKIVYVAVLPRRLKAILAKFPHFKNSREIAFGCSDLWDPFGGRELIMIGRWYSRQPLTSHKPVHPNDLKNSSYSFWIKEQQYIVVQFYPCF